MKTIIQSLFLIFVTLFFSACTEYYYDVTDELEGKVDEWGGKVDELEDKLDDNISKNGSRIIFREFLLEDGSVYRDNRPFDTLYNRVCQIEEDDVDRYSDNGGVDVYIGVLNGCCTFFDSIDSWYLEDFSDSSNELYSDSECTAPLETNYIFTPYTSMSDLKEGSFFKRTRKELHEDFYVTVIQRIEKILFDTEVYRRIGEECRLLPTRVPVILKKLSIEETRALFVCKAEAEER